MRNGEPIPYVLGWLGNQPLDEIPSGGSVLDKLLERADEEGVGGIVVEMLHRAGQAGSDSLKERTCGWFLLSARHSSVLHRLAQECSERGLEVLALKGAALIPTVYAGKLSCRPVSDLDLLAPDGREGEARSLSAAVSGEVAIDWHCSLLGDDRFPSRSQLLRLSSQEIWSMSRPFMAGIRHLEPELQFIHLSLHAFKHSCSRLIWLVDQALVLRTCDITRLLQLAARVGAERPVVVSLHILSRLLKEETARRHLKPLRPYEHLAVWLTCRRGHQIGWGELFLILSVPGLRHKWNYLLEYLFPGPAVLGEEGRKNRLKATLRRAWRFLWNKNRTRG